MRVALLLSGGIDSTAVAVLERPPLAITIDYGQITARSEIEAAAAVCGFLQIEHLVLCAPARFLTRGLLAGERGSGSDGEEFWPFRNQLLATLAAQAMFERGFTRLLFGTVLSDRGRFRDGSPEFFSSLGSLFALQEGGIEVHAPALQLSESELIRKSGITRQLLGITFSCHRGCTPCGDCPGCRKQATLSDLLEAWSLDSA